MPVRSPGLAPTGRHVRLDLAILFPWEPVPRRFGGEQIFVDRAALSGD
jgi:hypothetical protein